MAVDLVTADEMLKIDYRDGMHTDINERCPYLAMFEREGNEMAQEADTWRFALKIAPAQNDRTYGTRSPSQFARVDGEPVWRKVDVTYVVGYNPIRINPDIVWRAANGDASMINTLRETLKDLRDAHCHQMERQLCTGYGHDLYFELRTIPVASPWTYGIRDYAGLSNEQLGIIVELLNMQGLYINAADPTTSGSPAAYNTVRNGGTPVKITGHGATLSSETITVDNQIVGATIGDVVYRSRDESNGVQGTRDGLMGLVGNIDNYTLVDPFQTINSTDDTAASFQSRLINAGAAALSEPILMQATTLAAMRLGGGRQDGTAVRHVFCGNTITINDFAQSLTAILNTAGSEADRGRRVTYPVTREGFQPHYGYARQYLTYNGIPFVDGQLALRNSLFLVNLDDLVLLHNGPPEGDFLSPAGGGPNVLRVPGSPLSEYVWVYMNQLASRRRNGSVRIHNLASPSYA